MSGPAAALGRGTEHVGSEVVMRDAVDASNRQGELRWDRAAPSYPLAHELRSRANSLSKSRLASCRLYRDSDRGSAHVPRVALLSWLRNSIATSFCGARLLALLYG